MSPENPALAEEVISLRSIPSDLINGAMRDVVDFTVGFVRPSDSLDRAPELLGSGTLVSVAGKRAIVTAEHVLSHIKRAVPNDARLGLLLLPNLPRLSIALASVNCMPIARGRIDSQGPDLGAILLSADVAGSIAAKKNFYNLDRDRDQLLTNPPDRRHGFWFVSGFPATEAVREVDEDGEVVRFMNLHGVGGPEEPETRGVYDYYKFPVPEGNREQAPKSFGGMSGGGFWQIRIRRVPEGLVTLRPLLSGVVYFQIDTPQELALLCHGRRSVYEVAYRCIETGIAR